MGTLKRLERLKNTRSPGAPSESTPEFCRRGVTERNNPRHISNALAEQASRVEDFEWRTQRLDSRSTQNPLQNRLDRRATEGGGGGGLLMDTNIVAGIWRLVAHPFLTSNQNVVHSV